MFNTIYEALNLTGTFIQYGEKPTVLTNNNVHFSVEKNYIDHFNEIGKVERDGVYIKTRNISVINGTIADLELQVRIFQDNNNLHVNLINEPSPHPNQNKYHILGTIPKLYNKIVER